MIDLQDDLQANKALTRAFVEALGRDRIADAIALMGNDAVWWSPGRTMPPEALLESYRGIRPLLKGPLGLAIRTVTAEADRVSLEAQSDVELTTGARYNNNYHFLFLISGGKIVEIREHNDTLHAAQIFGPLG